MDVDFYRYFIGREDQSVNEKVMISRIDQQINVNKIMVDEFDLWKIPNRKLRHYMFNYLEIITVISTIMLIRSGTEENLLKNVNCGNILRIKTSVYSIICAPELWECNESAGQGRQKDFGCGISTVTESGRI